MNPIDAIIRTLSPSWALARQKARLELMAYEAAQPSRFRQPGKVTRSGDGETKHSTKPIREEARWMDQSHDLVVGILDTFVTNVVGTGITVEPQPRNRDGTINRDLAEQITEARRDWNLRPESTHELDNGAMERMVCRSWGRDGEAFGQHLVGNIPTLDHGTRVPYTVELLEADFCPIDYDEPDRNIIQGIERNAWGRPRGYWLYRHHPGDYYYPARIRPISGTQDLKRVNAERMQHIKHTRRIRQGRGVSLLAPVMTRLQDLRDYEQAEQIAAKIASAMALYLKKGTPDLYDPTATASTDEQGRTERDRLSQVAPGMMWIDLYQGEEVGTVDVSRPSNLLAPYREAMLRAAASGTGTGASSVSKNYNGTFSAQRQELVEQFGHYAAAQGAFISMWTRPLYQQWLSAAIAARVIRIPREIDPLTIDDAEFRGPVMPWVDPVKEANANLIQVQAGFKSRSQVIRERGGNPQAVMEQIRREREEQGGMVFTSDAASTRANPDSAAAGQEMMDDAEAA